MAKADWFPGATRREIASKVRSRDGRAPNAYVNHIAAGDSPSLFAFFSSPLRGCSHFYILFDGTIEQYLPISSRSMADVNGNRRIVSSEFQGGSLATRYLPYTAAQVEASAKIAAWLHAEWDIPLRLMENSHTTTAGVGYHRLGIDGNFPSDPLYGGRQQRGGGELWSNSSGKTCPDNFVRPPDDQSRIAQVPHMVTRALELTASKPVGDVKPTPLPPAPPAPPAGKIAEDGLWGRDTTSLLQERLGTPVDGEVWRQNAKWDDDNPGLTHGWKWDGVYGDGGSPLIHALYRHLRSKGISASVLGNDDGKIGPMHIKGLQQYLGMSSRDGELWAPSPTIKEMQKRLNAGTF